MIEKIEMVNEEAFEFDATLFETLGEIRKFADKLNEVIKAVNKIEGALSNPEPPTHSMGDILIREGVSLRSTSVGLPIY